jgi:hypothetical protein
MHLVEFVVPQDADDHLSGKGFARSRESPALGMSVTRKHNNIRIRLRRGKLCKLNM